MEMNQQSRLYIPALGRIWSMLDPLAHPILRIGFGGIIITHGLQKVFGWWTANDWDRYAQIWESIGYEPGMFWFLVVALTELIGGALIILGLFVRPAAGAFVIFMIMAIEYNTWDNARVLGSDWFWTQRGAEYSAMIMLVSIYLLIKGAGRFSIDRMLKREF